MKRMRFPSESTLLLNIDSFSKGINTSLDISKSPINYAYDIKNFSFDDGNLKNGLGFDDLSSLFKDNFETLKQDFENIGSIEKIFHFYIYNQKDNKREDKLIIINKELKIFYISLYENPLTIKSIRNISFSSVPTAKQYRLNGEDVIIFSSVTDNMIVWNGIDQPYEVLDAPKISSMALHYERLFVTVDGEKSAVWFSDDLDPTNWSISLDDAGFIELIDERGALLKVVSFCDYIYIFREYGISRLSAYGDQKNFAVSNLFVSTGRIYENSVCVCGDKIIFLAEDGLYKFDGLNTVKIIDNISDNLSNLDNKNVCACYHNGMYYLATKYRFFNENVPTNNNALLEIDINSYKLKNITSDIEIKYLLSIQTDKINGVFAVSKLSNHNNFIISIISNSGCFLSEPFEKSWLSPLSDLGKQENQKTLKKIYIQSINNVKVSIYHDNKISEFNFAGSIFTQTKRVNLPLTIFGFKITSNEKDCNIKNIKFLFGSVGGRE